MGDGGMKGDPSVFQDTFESIVQQNIEDFEMDRQEAVEDAVEQLKTQGVDVRFIVTDARAPGIPALIAELTELSTAAAAEPELEPEPRLSAVLASLAEFCAAGLPERCLAGRRGAYPPLLACLAGPARAAALRTLSALQDGQPDLFRPDDCAPLLAALRDQRRDALRWAHAVTLRHEANRQALAEAGLLTELSGLLRDPDTEPALLPAVCALVRNMTLDDDIRVPYGQAHEHARQLVEEHRLLDVLLDMLKGCKEEPSLAAEVIQTTTKLCVRKDFCEQFANGGGIDALLDAMRSNPNHTALIGRAFFLIRTLAGSDQVKGAIINAGAAEIIVSALEELKAKAAVCEAAFAAIASLTLRNKENAVALAAAGAIPVMVAAMEQHPAQGKVQKLACMAVRNMASRSPELRPTFRDLGAERLINDALQRHGKTVDDEARAALRDLECQVTLKEEWTGRGGALTTGAVTIPERLDD